MVKRSTRKAKNVPRPLKAAAKSKAVRSKVSKRKTKPSKTKASKTKPAKAVFTKSNIMPCLTYREAPAAVEFLCNAFGFAKKMVVEGEGGSIAHAELTLGNAMVMLGSHKGTDYGSLVKTPREAGTCTQTIYLIVPDPDAHHDRARAAGAEIVLPLATKDYGGRDYTCRDPEGHVWTFGTYDPWA